MVDWSQRAALTGTAPTHDGRQRRPLFADRRPQVVKPCHIDQLGVWPTVRGGPPATAVRFGNRLAPSVGRHLTGQKGLWGGPYDGPSWGIF